VHAVFDCAGHQRDSTASACSCLCWSAQLTVALSLLARSLFSRNTKSPRRERPPGRSVLPVFDCAGQQRDSTASACSCLCWSAQLTWLSLCWLARFFPEIRRVRGGKGRPEGQSCLFLTARASNVTARPARAAVCVGARSSPGSLSVGSLAFFQKYEESEEGKATKRVSARCF
jgi:hypothetical protein